MKKRKLFFTDAAIADVVEQADWYQSQSGRTLARRWERAVKSVVTFAIRRPGAGSRCTFKSAELHDVRRLPITGFPKHLLFYRYDEDVVSVLRVVHGARDLETLIS